MLILCGSPSDQFYLGGSPWTLGDGSTLRFGPAFSYRIPVPEDGPYILILTFREPVLTSPRQRSFSVLANSQPLVQALDPFLSAGLGQFSRTFLVFSANQFIVLDFSTIQRSALCSSINLSPFLIGAFPWLAPTTPDLTSS